MAALTMSKPAKTAGKGRVKLPVKRSINLAGAGEKPMNMKLGIPLIILILIAAAALGKFGVADRLNALSDARSEVSTLKQQLALTNKRLDEFADIEEKYAHYTYSGMSEEELSRADRTEAVKMIERVVLPQARMNSWSIKGNQLIMSVSSRTLQEINLLAQRLEEEENVDYCQVTAAETDTTYEFYDENAPVQTTASTESKNADEAEGEEEEEVVRAVYYGVSAQITAYLVADEEGSKA